jgi:hypothetical protein
MSFVDLKTMEDFITFELGSDVVAVVFNNQFENLLKNGEIIFFTLEDGYGTCYMKKGFGFSKPKVEMTIFSFDKDEFLSYRHKDIGKAIKVFEQFYKDGTRFFYEPGLQQERLMK